MTTARRLAALCIFLIALSTVLEPIRIEAATSELIPRNILNRHGLHRAWFSQIDLDRSSAKIAHVVHHVSRLRSTQSEGQPAELQGRYFVVYQVTYDGGSYSFSERDLDRFGTPLGTTGARRFANFKLEDLQLVGRSAKLSVLNIPEVTLFIQTTSGVLHALDGHTGQKRWSTSLGLGQRVNFAPAVNDQYVATVHGSSLLILNRDTGDILWEKRLRGAPGAGPALTDKQVFVPLYRGRVEVFPLEMTGNFRDSWYYSATGRTFSQPTANPDHVCWPTDRGFLYIGEPNKQGLRFRIETNSTISSPATFQGSRRVFVTSLDGYLHAINLTSGKVDWRFSTGEPINSSPAVIDQSVYVVTQYAGMYCVSSETGLEIWRSPHVRKFLAAGSDRIYCTGTPGQILVLNPRTGSLIDSLSVPGIDLTITNMQSDRIFLGTQTGMIQCLHASPLTWPLVYQAQKKAPPEEKTTDASTAPPSLPPSEPVDEKETTDDNEVDPFGVENEDPFGDD